MAAGGDHWKSVELKFEEFHELVVVRHQQGSFPEWSVDVFHNCIFKYNIGRWLCRHQEDLMQLARRVIRSDKLKCEVSPSHNIIAGKRAAKEKKGFKANVGTTSTAGGNVYTMASPVWLLLYLLSPNCMCNAKTRVKQHIAERSFAMLEVLVKVAYQGHTAASASGSKSDAPALKFEEGCAKLYADGRLEMDSRLTIWRETWSDLERHGNAVANLDAKPNSLAGLLWIWSRILMLFHVGKLDLSKSMQLIALNFVGVALDFIQVSMSKWTVSKQEPSSAVMLSLQKEGRRTHPGILSRLMGEITK